MLEDLTEQAELISTDAFESCAEGGTGGTGGGAAKTVILLEPTASCIFIYLIALKLWKFIPVKAPCCMKQWRLIKFVLVEVERKLQKLHSCLWRLKGRRCGDSLQL